MAATVAYKMPATAPGEQVVHYHDASGNSRSATSAIVLRVSIGSVDLQVQEADGRRRLVSDVMHVGDPRLESQPERRERGAWDYSETTKRMHDIEERLARVEAQLEKKK